MHMIKLFHRHVPSFLMRATYISMHGFCLVAKYRPQRKLIQEQLPLNCVMSGLWAICLFLEPESLQTTDAYIGRCRIFSSRTTQFPDLPWLSPDHQTKNPPDLRLPKPPTRKKKSNPQEISKARIPHGASQLRHQRPEGRLRSMSSPGPQSLESPLTTYIRYCTCIFCMVCMYTY